MHPDVQIADSHFPRDRVTSRRTDARHRSILCAVSCIYTCNLTESFCLWARGGALTCIMQHCISLISLSTRAILVEYLRVTRYRCIARRYSRIKRTISDTHLRENSCQLSRENSCSFCFASLLKENNYKKKVRDKRMAELKNKVLY